MRKTTAAGAIIAALLACCLGWPSSAAPAYMDPGEVKAGMEGDGYTVFHGSEPSQFGFKVIAVTKGDSGLSELIIVKVTGKQIEEIGGIAAGMSGSPCYIGGRLLGALSHVLQGPDPSIGIITPMSQMVKVLEAGKIAGLPAKVTAPGWGEFIPAAGPIWVSGLNQRALGNLRLRLGTFGFAAAPLLTLGTGISLQQSAPYAGGSSIAVQLCGGDVEAGTIGTITWSDGKTFLALGHPFMNLGAVDMPMSKSLVLAVLPSDDLPFKLGTFEKPGATVTQDRAFGIAGQIGSGTDLVEVRVKVNDMQTGRREDSSFSCVKDARLIEGLISSALLSVVDSAIMRVGEGTAYIAITADVSGTSLLREDMLWSQSDIADAISMELSSIMAAFMENDAQEAEIEAISVSLDIAPARLTSTITAVIPPDGGFVAGEAAQVGVVIRPFRGEEYTKYVEIEVPDDALKGSVSVEVHGGSSEDDTEVYTVVDKLGEIEGLGIAEIVEAIAGAEQNNELVIEIRYEAEGQQEEEGADPEGEGQEEPPLYSASVILHSIVKGFASEISEVK